jgi:hypothetical protein
MKRKQNNLKTDWYVGIWRNDKAVSPILFTISKTRQGIHVQAMDESDGEELIVSKVKLSGDVLSFETRESGLYNLPFENRC